MRGSVHHEPRNASPRAGALGSSAPGSLNRDVPRPHSWRSILPATFLPEASPSALGAFQTKYKEVHKKVKEGWALGGRWAPTLYPHHASHSCSSEEMYIDIYLFKLTPVF